MCFLQSVCFPASLEIIIQKSLPQHAFWMTHGFCSLPGQFILERIKERRLEVISACGQVHAGGMGTDNRKRGSLETISLILLPGYLQQRSFNGEYLKGIYSFKSTFNIIIFDLENDLMSCHHRYYRTGTTVLCLSKREYGLKKKSVETLF